jgi:preprotein translocase subunit YajC
MSQIGEFVVETLASLLPFVVIAVLFWLILIRPAQRRQRKAAATQRAADVGSEIMLTSGIYGTVKAADDETLDLEISPGTTVKVARGAVAKVVSETDTPDQAEDPAELPGESDGQ